MFAVPDADFVFCCSKEIREMYYIYPPNLDPQKVWCHHKALENPGFVMFG